MSNDLRPFNARYLPEPLFGRWQGIYNTCSHLHISKPLREEHGKVGSEFDASGEGDLDFL